MPVRANRPEKPVEPCARQRSRRLPEASKCPGAPRGLTGACSPGYKRMLHILTRCVEGLCVSTECRALVRNRPGSSMYRDPRGS